MDLGLTDRACIVTGASSGIGLATARALAAEGAGLVLAARDEERLSDAAAGLEGEPVTVALDVTASGAGTRLVEACLQAHGRVDAVVCNAGTSYAKPLDELGDEDWQGQWELNVMGPQRLMAAAAPVMAERGWGRIVNVCSSSGKRPSATNVAYSVTKAAQLSLSRAYADAFAAKGVLVNAVTPGPVDTPLWLADGGLADQAAEARGISRDEALEAQKSKIPLGRFGTDEEIAAAVVFLCSERASNVAGAAWSVDGGTVPVII
jgi:3-oxoacyl-[acyl-carrier protein] reductase